MAIFSPINAARPLFAEAARVFFGSKEVSSLRDRLIHGVIWSAVGTGFAQIITLLASYPVALNLGRETYGYFGALQLMIAAFAIFVGPTLGLTATKYIAVLRDSHKERAGRILFLSMASSWIVSLLVVSLMWTQASVLAKELLGAPELAGCVRIASWVLFFSGIGAAQIGVLSGLEAFRSIMRLNVVRGVLTLPALQLGSSNWGLPGALGGLLLISAITCLVGSVMVRSESRKSGIRPTAANCWHEKSILSAFSMPTLIGGAIVAPVLWIGSSMLLHQPGGPKEFGIFSAANNWRLALMFLPGVISQPFLPILSNLFGLGQIDRFTRVLKLNLAVTAVLAICPGLMIVAFSAGIMNRYGAGYESGSLVLCLQVGSAVLSSIIAVIGNAIASMGKMWHGSILNLIWAVSFILSAYFIVAMGAVGLSLALLVSYIVHLACVSLYVFTMMRRMGPRQTFVASG